MIYYFQAYYILCTMVMAGKDADSYQLKDRRDNPLSYARVKRWHRDGMILAALYIVPWLGKDWVFDAKICLAAILIRLVCFDIPFNIWAPLPWQYIGGTAWVDQQFVKIFGTAGAVKKSLTFLAILLAMNFLNHHFYE